MGKANAVDGDGEAIFLPWIRHQNAWDAVAAVAICIREERRRQSSRKHQVVGEATIVWI